MKTIVCVVLLAAAVLAEPPQYRQARFRSQKQEAEGQGFETGAAPYPAAGYRPTKEFNLPSRQEFSPPATNYGIPADSYGAPFNTYLTPQTEYGVPQEESEKEPKDDEVESVEDTKNEEQKENLQEEPKKDAEVVSNQGAYYVLLPGSQLQRVQFQTENDIRNMAYTARLQYRKEDRAPIFVYTAVPQYQSAAYVQLFK
ncbi:uncharacterized protein LOC124543512 [Vanessa cardui]|uniref:uncharacterized protein LOC124543512 n=1 Tax=Vanessa cardui TaxID=171605 RepID=UPI001F148817|nr:uncharacterized protein LOC124543512 [Vanessa cardui]